MNDLALSQKAQQQLAELANTLVQDDLVTDGWDDQHHKLTPRQRVDYLEPAVAHYAAELLIAIQDARQALLAEHRDGPIDWLGWRVNPDALARTVRGRS